MTVTPGAWMTSATDPGVPVSHASKTTPLPVRSTPLLFSGPNASANMIGLNPTLASDANCCLRAGGEVGAARGRPTVSCEATAWPPSLPPHV